MPLNCYLAARPGVGTTPESTLDVQVRVRELLSKLEATYINRTVVIVSADSNYLSVMESMVRGTDATMHHDLAFA